MLRNDFALDDVVHDNFTVLLNPKNRQAAGPPGEGNAGKPSGHYISKGSMERTGWPTSER